MKLKQLFLAATISIASISSGFAQTTEVLGSGSLSWGANVSKSGITAGVDNIFTFQSASASPASFDFQVYSYSNVTGLTATLKNLDLVTNNTVALPFISGSATEWDMENLNGQFTLNPGTHYSLEVAGTFTPWSGASSGTYNVAVAGIAYNPAIAAVPEPETLAMLLAGLGLIGFITRRRQGSQAALS